LKILRYDPFKILDEIGKKYVKMNIPPYLGLHPVSNVDWLQPYFPPLLE
jgi:hypothetical protein